MFRRLQLLGGAVFLLSACASPQAPTTSNVIAINSTPAGATASVSSGEWCLTPCTLTRPIAGTFTVRLQKDGFEPQEIRVEPETSNRATGQLRQARRDHELRRRPQQAQEVSYAPVMAQLQPLAGNPDAQIAALVYAQKVDPVLPQAARSNDLDKRAAQRQQFSVRVAGYDQAPVDFSPVSRTPAENEESDKSAEKKPDRTATSAPTNITASSFANAPRQPNPLTTEKATPVTGPSEATGAIDGGSSTAVDIPLEGNDPTSAAPVAPTVTAPVPPAAARQPGVEQDRQVALLTPEHRKTDTLPQKEAAQDLGNAVVQLASFRNQAAADQAVYRFKMQYADVLGDLIPDVQMADLGEKGIYYRVRFAGLATIEEARTICSGLSASGQGCMAVRR